MNRLLFAWIEIIRKKVWIHILYLWLKTHSSNKTCKTPKTFSLPYVSIAQISQKFNNIRCNALMMYFYFYSIFFCMPLLLFVFFFSLHLFITYFLYTRITFVIDVDFSHQKEFINNNWTCKISLEIWNACIEIVFVRKKYTTN